MRYISVVCCAFVFAFMAGCGSSDSTTVASDQRGKAADAIIVADSIVGKYKAAMDLGEDETDGEDAMGDEVAKAFAEMFTATMALELKDDGTFDMQMFMIPITGTWTRTEDLLTLTAEKVMGMTFEEFEKMEGVDVEPEGFEEPMKFLISADNKTLTLIDEDPDAALQFIRDES